MSQEQDIRLSILNSLLKTPHRGLEPVYKLHKDFIAQDPLFYVQLAAWYHDHGDIRDHREVFIITLCLSEHIEMREVGLALLSKLPPHQVQRVVDFIHKDLKVNITRSMKTEVTRYLQKREANDSWFDSSVLRARKSIKRLYALLRVKPSDRAQAILFDNNPPADSLLYTLKQLAKESDPTKQAEILIENKVPYTTAVSVVKNMTPAVIFALVNSMSSQELINNMGSLKERGALDNPEIKELVNSKLKKAKKAKNVSALKSLKAVEAAGIEGDLKDQLEDVADTQLKKKGTIKRPTALLIDKSSSMGAAIEIGKQLGSMIASAMEDGVSFYCYAFDEAPIKIKANGQSVADWEKAMKFIKAGGCTANAAPLVAMAKTGEKVEQIVMVTDEGENCTPAYLKCVKMYADHFNIDVPYHVILRCGNRYSWGKISDKLVRAEIDTDVYEFTQGTDYYGLPNVLHYLTKPSKLELLMEIMSYELPQREIPVQKAFV